MPRMKNFYVLVRALDFMEDHLTDPITQEDIAAACYCSLSSLQKLLRYAIHVSVKEYLTKRRLTMAAQDLLHTDMTVTQIALRYQYSAPEVFTRAFVKLWGVKPSAFKDHWKFAGLFPRIRQIPTQQEVPIMRKTVELDKLYDTIQQMDGTYVICFDIQGLHAVNQNIGREAGDLIIRECLHRIDSAAGEEMTLFRIGGDEFALATGLIDLDTAQELGETILAQNGQCVTCQGQSIPVAMWVGLLPMHTGQLNDQQMLQQLGRAIEAAKGQGSGQIAIL